MSTILAASLLAGVACAAGAVPLTGSTGSMPKAQVEHLAPADSPLRDVLGDTFKISILGANFSAGQAASLFSGTFAFQNGSIAGVTAFGAPLSLTLDQAQIAPNQYRLTITAQVTDPAAEILPGGVTFSNGTLITSLGLDIGDSTFGGGADGLNPPAGSPSTPPRSTPRSTASSAWTSTSSPPSPSSAPTPSAPAATSPPAGTASTASASTGSASR